MNRYNPPEYAHAGEMIYEARFRNSASKAKYWYTLIPEGEGEATFKNEESFDGRYQVSIDFR